MTRAQAKDYTDKLCKADDLLVRVMEELEWHGMLTPDLEEAYNIISKLPEYEATEE